MSKSSKWHYHIGPEANTAPEGLPYVDAGWKVHYNWLKVHTWCSNNNMEYGWNGSRFHFTNLDDLLYFCDTWLHEDEVEVLDDGF